MPSLVAWAPEGQEVIGAIEVKQGSLLTRDDYLLHLGFRVRQMAMEAAPDELAQAESLLMEAGLLDVPMDDPEQAGAMLVWENAQVQTRLRELGIPGALVTEPRILRSNPAAVEALKATTLPMWATELAASLIERD